MKAAVCRTYGTPLIVEDIELKKPKEKEVLVDIKACAICHSDISAIEGIWDNPLPAIFGHEAAGIIREIGDGVEGLQVGDHVIVTLIRNCFECHYCSQGQHLNCESEFSLDSREILHDQNGQNIIQGIATGAFAEQALVFHSQCVKIDPELPFDIASLLACGVITGFGAAINTAQIKAGQSVVIIGAGGVGMNAIQGAHIAGATPIIAVDIDEGKLSLSKNFGATHGINAKKNINEIEEEIKSLTQDRGADHVIISLGRAQSLEDALALLAKNGKITIAGMPPTGAFAQVEPTNIAYYQQTIQGSRMGATNLRRDIPYLIALYRSGRLKLDELISNRYSLEDINKAIEDAKLGQSLRNVIMMDL